MTDTPHEPAAKGAAEASGGRTLRAPFDMVDRIETVYDEAPESAGPQPYRVWVLMESSPIIGA